MEIRCFQLNTSGIAATGPLLTNLGLLIFSSSTVIVRFAVALRGGCP